MDLCLRVRREGNATTDWTRKSVEAQQERGGANQQRWRRDRR